LGLCISGKLRGNVIQNRISRKAHRELLLAFESARSRLAIAIAAETKSTPLDQWQYYLETADRMCRFARKLRNGDLNVPPGHKEWAHALETLKLLPIQDTALRLCRILGETVGRLEGGMGKESHARKEQNTHAGDSTDFAIL
jgi:hypothetical protein